MISAVSMINNWSLCSQKEDFFFIWAGRCLLCSYHWSDALYRIIVGFGYFASIKIQSWAGGNQARAQADQNNGIAAEAKHKAYWRKAS